MKITMMNHDVKYLDVMYIYGNIKIRIALLRLMTSPQDMPEVVQRDPIDTFVDQWGRERPDLNTAPLGVVSRILMLAKRLEHSADLALARFGVSLAQLDVLAALRRSGPPYKLSPTRLMEFVTLTSGAMTNRIDRLEELGLVARESDPQDRRGVLAALTDAGRQLVDAAIVVRLEEARRSISRLSDADAAALAALLRELLCGHAAPTGDERRRR